MSQRSWKWVFAAVTTMLLVSSTAVAMPKEASQTEKPVNENTVTPNHPAPIIPPIPATPPTPNRNKDENPNLKYQKTAKLIVKVIDGRTMQPLPGAAVVLVETEDRVRTGADGMTPPIDAPVIREEQYSRLVAQLHGQLGLVAYKNGYRDAISFGVRMHEGKITRITMWMYQINRGPDRRIEPTFYHEPYHHLWLVELADHFRRPPEIGEGPEGPNQ